MSNQTKTTDVFEATLRLRQEGKDGDVQAFLTFAPLDAEAGPENQPEAFNRMAFLMQTYLYMTGTIDARGNLIEPFEDDIDVEIEAMPANKSIN